MFIRTSCTMKYISFQKQANKISKLTPKNISYNLFCTVIFSFCYVFVFMKFFSQVSLSLQFYLKSSIFIREMKCLFIHTSLSINLVELKTLETVGESILYRHQHTLSPPFRLIIHTSHETLNLCLFNFLADLTLKIDFKYPLN